MKLTILAVVLLLFTFSSQTVFAAKAAADIHLTYMQMISVSEIGSNATMPGQILVQAPPNSEISVTTSGNVTLINTTGRTTTAQFDFLLDEIRNSSLIDSLMITETLISDKEIQHRFTTNSAFFMRVLPYRINHGLGTDSAGITWAGEFTLNVDFN